MIRRYVFGKPFDTEVIVKKPDVEKTLIPYFINKCNVFSFLMNDDDIVYGLGENVRGINKRGFIYESFCSDDCEHTEDKKSLYGAHNFFIVSRRKNSFGVFFDSPGKVTFDIGATEYSKIEVIVENPDFEVYIIDALPLEEIVKEFRKISGPSYIPPKWAFGIGQSRWGYKSAEDIKQVAEGYKKNGIPLDMIYLDIDYMDKYKDFTVNKDSFPDFEQFVEQMKENSIHLIPIIDAGIKAEDGFEVYDDAKKNDYFCKDADGNDFIVGVWPGKCCIPDFLNPKTREWFGLKYKFLTDMGIEGFWNDMNEPALFYSEKNLAETFNKIIDMQKLNIGLSESFELKDTVKNLANNIDDYKSFFHNVNGKKIPNYAVHNLFGFNMTRAASEAFKKICPEKRILMFSRASCIGAHRYGGIWMGDNKSVWSHLLLNLKMLPSLNMCGFLYTGADIGGFGADVTEDLLLRWYALGIFMPLLRNHSALGTRNQEPFNFVNRITDFRNILMLRYRLLPYIYSEFMKAALTDNMYSKPLGFIWQDDEDARRTEDQIMIGNAIMIAPIYEQNATGRHVYVPEEMKLIRFKNTKICEEKILPQGHCYINIALDEIVIFIRKGCVIPLADCAESIDKVEFSKLQLIGFTEQNAFYELYDDDGKTTCPDLKSGLKKITCSSDLNK